MRLRVDASLSGLCARSGEMLRCDDARTDLRVDRDTAMAVGAISMLCVPLADAAGVAGVLKVYSDHANAFDEADALILTQLSAVIASHMRRAEEYERRAFESRHDVLTDVGNRRAYEERLATEVARAARYDHRLSVVLLDLDRFKPVNDRFGHPEGDEVLRRVGAALRSVRAADDCFRIGGDEFALILPETDGAGARIVTGRVRDAIADAAARWGVTATAGVADYSGGDWSDLHATADAALVAAKRGR
jgi:diguanylate cyclase (GGDEF)-like protein